MKERLNTCIAIETRFPSCTPLLLSVHKPQARTHSFFNRLPPYLFAARDHACRNDGQSPACGFLLATNCSALEQAAKKKQAWLLSVGALVVVLAMAYVLPKSVPASPFIFLNAAFGHYATQYLLGKVMKEQMANDGPVTSNRRAAGIALLVVVAIVAVWLLAFAALSPNSLRN